MSAEQVGATTRDRRRREERPELREDDVRAFRGDGEITAAGAPVRTLVIGAREDLEIVREVREVLGMPGST